MTPVSELSRKLHKWGTTVAFVVVVAINAVTFGIIQSNRQEVVKLNDNFCASIAIDREGIRDGVERAISQSTRPEVKATLQAILNTYPEIQC